MWDILQRSKDTALAAGARAWLNHRLRAFGKMTELAFDAKNRRVRVRLELEGETAPVEIEVTRYSLRESGGATSIVIEEAHSSRPWLTTALREFVIGRAWPLPAQARAALKLFG